MAEEGEVIHLSKVYGGRVHDFNIRKTEKTSSPFKHHRGTCESEKWLLKKSNLKP
jgi:hypothetical protein